MERQRRTWLLRLPFVNIAVFETDAVVLQGALEVYGARITEDTTTQEALAYLEHMVRLKVRLDSPAPASAAP